MSGFVLWTILRLVFLDEWYIEIVREVLSMLSIFQMEILTAEMHIKKQMLLSKVYNRQFSCHIELNCSVTTCVMI